MLAFTWKTNGHSVDKSTKQSVSEGTGNTLTTCPLYKAPENKRDFCSIAPSTEAVSTPKRTTGIQMSGEGEL